MEIDCKIAIPVGGTFMIGHDKFQVDEYVVKDWREFDRREHCNRCYFQQIADELGPAYIRNHPYVETTILPCENLACSVMDRADNKLVFFTKIGGRV